MNDYLLDNLAPSKKLDRQSTETGLLSVVRNNDPKTCLLVVAAPFSPNPKKFLLESGGVAHVILVTAFISKIQIWVLGLGIAKK